MARKRTKNSNDEDYVTPSKVSASGSQLKPEPPPTAEFEPLNIPIQKGQHANITLPTYMQTPYNLFRLFFDDLACDIIIKSTNQRAAREREVHRTSGSTEKLRIWKVLVRDEFLAFLGQFSD
jgi:hypothetical protein